MASSSTNAKGKEPLRSISGNHSGSGDESSYGDQSGYGDDSGCEDHSGYVDHSQSGEFPSYDTPPEFFNSNGSYDSLEFESGNWVYNRAMTPRWSQRPICTCGHSCTYSEWKQPGEHYKKRYWNCPRFLNTPKDVGFVISLSLILCIYMSLN